MFIYKLIILYLKIKCGQICGQSVKRFIEIIYFFFSVIPIILKINNYQFVNIILTLQMYRHIYADVIYNKRPSKIKLKGRFY